MPQTQTERTAPNAAVVHDPVTWTAWVVGLAGFLVEIGADTPNSIQDMVTVLGGGAGSASATAPDERRAAGARLGVNGFLRVLSGVRPHPSAAACAALLETAMPFLSDHGSNE